MIRLKHASAAEVARILTALEQQNQQNAQKQGGQLEGRSTFIADERTNSILLGGAKSNRLQLRALISNLDVPLEREGNIHVVYLRYANAKELAPVLTGIGQKVAEQVQGNKGGAVVAGAAQSKSQSFDIQADESTMP